MTETGVPKMTHQHRRVLMAVEGYVPVDQQQEWRELVARVRSEVSGEVVVVPRWLVDELGDDIPPHRCEFTTNPEKGECRFHNAWADLLSATPDTKEERG